MTPKNEVGSVAPVSVVNGLQPNVNRQFLAQLRQIKQRDVEVLLKKAYMGAR